MVVILWFGSRPIPAGNFEEKPRGLAFISIMFPKAVESVILTASEPSTTDVLELQPSRSRSGIDGTVWDVDRINPPGAGCWTYTIMATTDEGTEILAPFIFVAVE
ncbi:MAG: hypothetical protein ACR2GI_05210 [Thermomicrobiales bacterium]